MATMDASQVTFGSAKTTGAIWVAPENTAPPTDATTSMATFTSFNLLGFTSDAGVQIAESREAEEIRAWEGRKKIFELVTEYTENVSFTPIQCNSDVAKLIWGDSKVTVGGNGALTIKHHGEQMEPVVIVIETVSPDNSLVRRNVGTFQLTERGEQTMDGTQVDGRQLTFSSIADDDGITMTEYIASIATTTTTTGA